MSSEEDKEKKLKELDAEYNEVMTKYYNLKFKRDELVNKINLERKLSLEKEWLDKFEERKNQIYELVKQADKKLIEAAKLSDKFCIPFLSAKDMYVPLSWRNKNLTAEQERDLLGFETQKISYGWLSSQGNCF